MGTIHLMICLVSPSKSDGELPNMQWIYQFSQQKLSWAILAVSALGLLLAALYFQHMMGLQPCINCIYQRTAVIGILVAGIIPLIYMHFATRILAFFVWAYSCIQGIIVARAHLDIIFSKSPFPAICDIVPKFPTFMPMHEWVPSIFAATGSCNENSWQFLGLGMANWLQIIFSVYLVILGVVLVAQLWCRFISPKSN